MALLQNLTTLELRNFEDLGDSAACFDRTLRGGVCLARLQGLDQVDRFLLGIEP